MEKAYSNQIRTERAIHHGKKVIKLIFGIDAALTAIVRQICALLLWFTAKRTVEHED